MFFPMVAHAVHPIFTYSLSLEIVHFSKFQVISIFPSELTTVVQNQNDPKEITMNVVSCVAL